MGRSQESFNKKEVRRKKEKKRKDKEKKKSEKREGEKNNLDDMIAYVDKNGVITSTPPDPNEKEDDIKAEDILVSVPNRSKEDEPDPIRKGTLTFFNDSKGYGFIKDSETKDSVFVHANNILEEINEGNIVSFEVERGPKGLVAVNVKLVK